MGAVFRAQHALIPDVYAALKVMKPGQVDDAAERFLREVKAVLRLNHPGIVRVSGFGRDERRGLLWMAMDLVEGGDLEVLLARGSMDLQNVLVMFAGLADALAHAHQHGVFHRDLKPSNVLLDAQGRARLVDFGIAVQQQDSRLTSTGMVIGTPAYLPPELFGGDDADPALGDLYAFGQMMFEAATGRPAFPDDPDLADSQRLVRLMGQKVRSHALDPGEGFPDGFRGLVRHLTEPEPSERLASAAELAARLATLAQTGGHAVRPAPPLRASNRPKKSGFVKWLAAGGAAVVVLLSAGIGITAVVAMVAWMAVRAQQAQVPAVPPAAEVPEVVDLTGLPDFIAAAEAVSPTACADGLGAGSHVAKVQVRIEGGRVVEASPIADSGPAAFADCMVAAVYRSGVDVPDGEGVWTFRHAEQRRDPPSSKPASKPASKPTAVAEPQRKPAQVEPSHKSDDLAVGAPPATVSQPVDAPAPPTAQDIAAEFQRAMAKAQVPVQQCYYRAQAEEPGLAGTIVLAFDLMPDGSTQNVKVVRSELDNATVEQCAVDAFSTIRLTPRPGGQVMRQPSFALKLGTR